MRFLANDSMVETDAFKAAPALDFIRRELGLTGTKEGCREGDCGACAVIVGRRPRGEEAGAPDRPAFEYRAMPSCLLALGELEGRHLLTIEGLAAGAKAAAGTAAVRAALEPGRPALTPVMAAISEANGSQCGFCSPGFVMSLTAYILNGDPGGGLSVEGAAEAVSGNLCRCTGYGAIKRAAERLVKDFAGLPADPEARLAALVEAAVLPRSCLAFARGELLGAEAPAATAPAGAPATFVAGGSDYFVRNPDPEPSKVGAFDLLDRRPELKRITREAAAASNGAADAAEYVVFGAALNWREFFASAELRALVPGIERFEAALASPLVRERATLGGNIANASPVGDVTSMLIALGAALRLSKGGSRRELPIENFFQGYKKIDLAPGEIIEAILLPAAGPCGFFNFEKVAKRERLDIAAVNSAAVIEVDDRRRITRARISAGGVAATPLLLKGTCALLEGRELCAATVRAAALAASAEARPISDVRGSADYRRRILERLVVAHFIRLFPGSGAEEALR